ncbi:MAG: DNA polymerase ligase N-terminal domain-containing protein, partial [Thermodesulfobacteriota bacterium]
MNGTNRFLIHKHHTEFPHFDLRLELGGILKSWVLPKRIPCEVNEKRLAIEDGEKELNAVINLETIHDHYGVGRVELCDSGS